MLARLAALSLPGMDDVAHYERWGRAANAHGLVSTYHGIYFPLQYQVFQLAAVIADAGHWDAGVVLRGITLLFELGVLVLVATGPGGFHAAALFWCHPWYLLFFGLGYIDSQFAFFALLTARAAERAAGLFGYLTAGLPLGLAFVMKPQALALLAASTFFTVARSLKSGTRAALGFLVPSGLLFAAYNMAFVLAGASFWALLISYLDVPGVMPALTANMPNVWYLPADALSAGRPIYYVADLYPVVGSLVLRDLATFTCVGLLLIYALCLSKGSRPQGNWTLLFGFAATTLPMVMTNAHESHLFLGTLFLLQLLPWAGRPVRVAIHVLLAVQFANLLGIYGGAGLVREPLAALYAARTRTVALVGSLVASAAYFVVLDWFFAMAGQRPVTRRCVIAAVLMIVAAGSVAAIVRAR
jgi:hypothetical protein